MNKKINGVTFYFANEKKCIDIDVEPGTEEVSFGNSSKYDNIEYQLQNCNKSFPNVKRLVFDCSVRCILMPNALFPNVKEVMCDSSYGRIKSGTNRVLMMDSYGAGVGFSRNSGWYVSNTFIAGSDESVDLKGATCIIDNAFAGCKSTKIINSGSVKKCKKDAFKDSAIGDLKPEKGKAVIVGTILVDIDHTSEDIIINDSKAALTAIRDGVNFNGIKRITVNRIQTLLNLQDKIPSEITVFLKDKSLINHEQLAMWKRIPRLELCDDNPYYSSRNGLLYTKDGTTLVKCPSSVTGALHVPEGTIAIAANAFFRSLVEEVHFPDSVRMLMPNCFQDCQFLKKVDFGTGIEEIGFGHETNIFNGCKLLCSVEIPEQVRVIAEAAFKDSGVQHVVFHEGLTQILDDAFSGCAIKEVYVPASLMYIGNNNFTCAECIELAKNEEPYGLVSAVVLDTFRQGPAYVKIKKPDSVIFMPKAMSPDSIKAADMNLAVSSFRSKCEECFYEYGLEPDIKWDTAIAAYKHAPNDTTKTYLRRVSKNIVNRFLMNNNETGLIEYLKLGIMTPKALDDTYKTAKKNNMTTVMAYILDEKNKAESSETSFKL